MNLDDDEVETLDETTTEEIGEDISSEETSTEGDEEAPEDEGLVVRFGDEEADEEEEPNHREALRNMRARLKELEKERDELRTKSEPKKTKLGDKPTLESCDFDQDVYETKLAQWFEDKRKDDEENARDEERQRKEDERWQSRLSDFHEKKAVLAKRVPDMEEAEAFILETFDVTQQGILVDMADDGAVLAYALSKNQKKAKELAAEKSPVHFTKKLALLEASMKTTTRKAPPPADNPLKGTRGMSGSVDGELARLREDAAKTGDFSKVHAYKKSKR